jgi:hypothetical protein
MLSASKRTLLGLGTAALLLSLASPPTERRHRDCPVLPAGSWELVWDDVVDHELSAEPKTTGVQLSVRGDRVRGAFRGPVLGELRDAHFTGEVIHAEGTPVVLLQQHEPDYRCLYQLQQQTSGELFGVWHDTRGRSGDVRLARVVDVPVGLRTTSASGAR